MTRYAGRVRFRNRSRQSRRRQAAFSALSPRCCARCLRHGYDSLHAHPFLSTAQRASRRHCRRRLLTVTTRLLPLSYWVARCAFGVMDGMGVCDEGLPSPIL